MSVNSRITWNAVICVVCLLSGIANGCTLFRSPVKEQINGWLLPGPELARAFSVDSVTKIVEVDVSEIRPAVLMEMESQTRQRQRPFECVRYFPVDSIVIAVLPAFCGTRYGRQTDGRNFIAVTQSGTYLGEIFWRSREGISELFPFDRFTPLDR